MQGMRNAFQRLPCRACRSPRRCRVFRISEEKAQLEKPTQFLTVSIRPIASTLFKSCFWFKCLVTSLAGGLVDRCFMRWNFFIFSFRCPVLTKFPSNPCWKFDNTDANLALGSLFSSYACTFLRPSFFFVFLYLEIWVCVLVWSFLPPDGLECTLLRTMSMFQFW